MSESNWRDELSDELKGNESLSSFEDVEGLAKSFIETKAMVGSGIQVPSEDAGDDAKKTFIEKILSKAPGLMIKPNFDDNEQSVEFFRTLGLPDDSAGYETAEYEDSKFDESRETALRKMAYEARLTVSQYKLLSRGMLKFDHEVRINGESATSEEMTELRQSWGMAWDERKKLANKVRETFLDFIPESQMDAKTIKSLYAIGIQLGSEDGMQGEHRNDNNDTHAMTPADALARIDEIMHNDKHAYWTSMDPGHEDALKKMIELRKAADPTAGTVLPRAGFGT